MTGEMIVTIVLIVVSGSTLAFLGWLAYRALTPPRQNHNTTQEEAARVAQEYHEADAATQALDELKRVTKDLKERQQFTDQQLTHIRRLVWEMVDIVRGLAARTHELQQRRSRYLEALEDDAIMTQMAGALRDDPAGVLLGDRVTMDLAGDYVKSSLQRQAAGLEQDIMQLQGLGQAWIEELGAFSTSLNWLETTLDASRGLPTIQSIRIGLNEAREALGIRSPERIRELSVSPVKQLERPH